MTDTTTAFSTTRAATPFMRTFGDWTPRGVVFDCDGILLDTESVWQGTQARMLQEFGGSFGPEQEAAAHGSTVEVAAALIAEASGAPYERVLARTCESFEQDIGNDVRRKPGAREVVEAAAARVPIACASNSWHALLVSKLTAAGLIGHFTHLEGADTVERGKPYPDMYLSASAAIGAAPRDALAIEDSPTGARAARDAGLRLLTVPESGPAPPCDLSLTTLADPALLAWISTW